jgi:hypothetical protein
MPTLSISKLCTGFFSSQHKHTQTNPQQVRSKGVFDHIHDHLMTANGAWDFFRVFDHAVSFLKYLPSLTPNYRDFFNKVSGVMNKAGIALSLPKIIIDVNNVCGSMSSLRHVQTTSPLDPDRDKQIGYAYKKSLVDGMNLVNTTSQISLFLNEVSLISLGKHGVKVDFIYNLSSIVNDTIEFFEEIVKLRDFGSHSTRSESEETMLQEKKNLSWMKIAKAAPSIMGSALAISSLFFTLFQAPVLAAVSLGLSACWLTMKLTSMLYEKIIAEKHARPRLI